MLWKHQGVDEATWEREGTMRTNYPCFIKDEGTLSSHLMHVIVCIYVCEFWDEILLRMEECKTREKSNFLEKGKNSKSSL